MARYGTYHLLTKYNNPTSRSPRILINTKSYYHPYKFRYRTEYEVILTNSTMIDNYTLELNKSIFYLSFSYKTQYEIITFLRGNRDNYSIAIQSNSPEQWKRNLYVYRLSSDVNFQTDDNVPNEFQIFIRKITGTSLSEIYQKYLPALIKLMI